MALFRPALTCVAVDMGLVPRRTQCLISDLGCVGALPPIDGGARFRNTVHGVLRGKSQEANWGISYVNAFREMCSVMISRMARGCNGRQVICLTSPLSCPGIQAVRGPLSVSPVRWGW